MDLYSIRKPAIGKISAINKTNYTSIASSQIEEGDLILCRGQWMMTYNRGVHDMV